VEQSAVVGSRGFTFREPSRFAPGFGFARCFPGAASRFPPTPGAGVSDLVLEKKNRLKTSAKKKRILESRKHTKKVTTKL
jgi:hypothetical protein